MSLDIDVLSSADELRAYRGKPILIELNNLDPASVVPAKATASGGRFAIQNFRAALQYAGAGKAAAVFFTPFNKHAMRLAEPSYDDEINFVRGALKHSGAASEFNVLGGLATCHHYSFTPLLPLRLSPRPRQAWSTTPRQCRLGRRKRYTWHR